MTATLYAVTFDCADAAALAGFWAGVLGRPVDDGATPGFASIGLGENSRPHWMFVQVPEGKTAKNRMHADLIIDVADLAAETERLLGLGAVKLAEHEDDGTRWVTLADPDGNEFDVMADGQ
jgi:catechol 2,3-dioxygenase-like lactoylglutathione lyase family enzyme